MKTNKRMIIWIVALVIGILATVIENLANQPKPEKQHVTAYVAKELKKQNAAIEKNFNRSQLGKQYSLKVSNKPVEDLQFIITQNLAELSSYSSYNDYEVIANSPLIVILKQDKKTIKKLVSSELLSAEEIYLKSDDEVEIHFKELMDAVIHDKNWKTFGLNDKEIKIYYPELTTFEGKLFYQFLLITANDGDYPKEETQLESSQEYVECFLEKSNVKGIDVMTRLTGVNDIGNDIYITFENNALQLNSIDYSDELYIAYPTETIEKQIYFQSTTPVGDEVLNNLANGGFTYSSINKLLNKYVAYRIAGNIYDLYNYLNFKNSYNPIEIPEETLKELEVE